MLKHNNQNENITPIAITNWRDIRKKFGIKEKNRRGHMYIVGKTGVGKSNLIATMAVSDIKQGNGLCVIDPHGDLAETLLDHIPESRINDVVYFNPLDTEHPFAFNPLNQVYPQNDYIIVSSLISIFKKIWSDFWGPRLEHILRNSLFTLLECENTTILDIPPLLTNKYFRKELLQNVTNKHILSFWQNEFDKYSSWLKADATAPVLNKIGQFLTNPLLRNIVGQKHNSFSIRSIMDNKKILIVNLSKGIIGEDNSSLLGAMLINAIYLSALSRADSEIDQRTGFYLYVDEFHNFISTSFIDMLSESRKYGLSLVLANQYLDQLKEEIRNSIFGNIGSLISFRVGLSDAEYLYKEFDKVFTQNDLITLPNYNIFIKLMIDGITSKPFSATTIDLPLAETSYRKRIIDESRMRFGRPKDMVEKEIDSHTYNDMHMKDNRQLGLFK